MELPVDLLQPRLINVCVDLRGRNAGVSQHFLDLTQVRSPRQNVGCKTVSQRVGTD